MPVRKETTPSDIAMPLGASGALLALLPALECGNGVQSNSLRVIIRLEGCQSFSLSGAGGDRVAIGLSLRPNLSEEISVPDLAEENISLFGSRLRERQMNHGSSGYSSGTLQSDHIAVHVLDLIPAGRQQLVAGPKSEGHINSNGFLVLGIG
jgi:hypothetical protein